MNQPATILERGTRVLTHDTLEQAGPLWVTDRRPATEGTIWGVVGGYGGDVYHVKHADNSIGAYSFSEFDLAPDPAAGLRAAKERLGAWLAAESYRSHVVNAYGALGAPGTYRCRLITAELDASWFDDIASGEGPTEAAAILAALEKAGA